MPIKIHCLPQGKAAANCYVVYDEVSKDAILLDPGFGDSNIFKYITQQRLGLKAVILTHAHCDNIYGVWYLKKMYPRISSYLHAADAELYAAQQENGPQVGLICPPEFVPAPDRLMQEGQTFRCGEHVFTVMHTPGHTPGSIMLIEKTQRLIFSGDSLRIAGRQELVEMGVDEAAYGETLVKVRAELQNGYTVYPTHGDPQSSGALLKKL